MPDKLSERTKENAAKIAEVLADAGLITQAVVFVTCPDRRLEILREISRIPREIGGGQDERNV